MPQPKEAREVSYYAFYQNPESYRDDLAAILPSWELLPVESWMKPEDWVRYLSKSIPPNSISLALNAPRDVDHAGLVMFTSSPPIKISISLGNVTRVQIRPDIEQPQLRFTNNDGALLLVTRMPQGGILVSPSESPHSGLLRRATSTSVRIQYT